MSVSQLPDRGPVPGLDRPEETTIGYKISLVQLITNLFVNMPHLIHKCTNALYDYAIINY